MSKSPTEIEMEISEKEKIEFFQPQVNINVGDEESDSKHLNVADSACKIEEDADTKKLHKYSGVIFALLGGLCFTLASLLAKVLKDCDPINLTVWRYFGFIILIIPVYLYNVLIQKENICAKKHESIGEEHDGKLRTILFLWMSAFLSSTAMILIFCSLSYMSLADSTVVLFCGPVFVVVFAHFCLQEKCGIVTIPIAIWTMLGVLIITRPPMITGESNFDQHTLIGTGLCFGALLCLAVYFILMRTLRQIHITLISIINGVCGFIESAIVAILFDVLRYPTGTREILLTVLLSIVAFLAQIFITLALKFETAGTVSMVRASDVIFAFLWQIIFLDLNPDMYSNIGAVIVVIGVLLTTFRKWLSTLPKEGHCMRDTFGFLLK